MNIEQVKKRLEIMADAIEENKEYLSDLDSEIGDGDHGFNMAKGFGVIREDLKSDYNDLKSLFMKISTDLISKVGGASGPLYGTFFLRFAGNLTGKTELTREDFNKSFELGVEGVKMRGKAGIGDKTMIDVLEPVSIALNQGKDFSDIIKLAEEKRDYTKEIKANKGRASYLGERSIGHLDPGATSSCILIQKALEE